MFYLGVFYYHFYNRTDTDDLLGTCELRKILVCIYTQKERVLPFFYIYRI